MYNHRYSHQLDSLADVLTETTPKVDSTVRTTQKKTTTTTYLPETEEKKNSFFGKLFGGKKKNTAEPERKVEVKEELVVSVDTVAIAQQDSAIVQVGRIMKNLEADKRLQTQQMLQQELELINTNLYLLNQLLSILQEVENEEVAAIEKKNAEAGMLVSESIERIGTIIIVFFLFMAVLVFLIMVDISRSNYYRLQLVNAKNKAEELGKVKQRFLANMSHEIRTPLQSIIGYAEQLSDPLYRHEATKAIQNSSEHLLQIVNEILDFSRIESDTFTLDQRPFALHAAVEEVAEAMRIQAAKKGLSFIVEYPPDGDVMVIGDAFRVRQILYNLLGNAIKFTGQGEVKLQVTVKRDLYVKCVFRVSDTGIGIYPKDKQRIFGQFEQGQAHTSQLYGGSGLGLSIVKKLAELYNGSVYVQSEPGKGSTFTVELNFEKAGVATEQPGDAKRMITAPQRHQRVLLVDDDPLILRLGSILLNKYKISHRAIADAEEAMLVDVENLDFIFLDIRMPHISGIQLCQSFRKRKTKAKIIALTAHVIPQEQDTILNSGFDQILMKPFREQQLLDILGVDAQLADEQQNELSQDFSLNELKAITMGDDQLLNAIVDQYVEDTQHNIEEMKKALEENDGAVLREVVHKLAGRTGQIGSRDIAAALAEIESLLDQGIFDSAVHEKTLTAMERVKKLLTWLTKETAMQSSL